ASATLSLHDALPISPGRVETLDGGPDEGGRSALVVVSQLGAEEGEPELLERPIPGVPSEPGLDRCPLERPPVPQPRAIEDGPSHAELVDHAQPGVLEVLDHVGNRVQLAVGEDTGTGLDPSDLIGQPEALEEGEHVGVAVEDDVIVPVPGDVSDPPWRGQAAQVVGAFDQGDSFAAVGQP